MTARWGGAHRCTRSVPTHHLLSQFHPQSAEPIFASPLLCDFVVSHAPKSGRVSFSFAGIFNDHAIVRQRDKLLEKIGVILEFASKRPSHEVEVISGAGLNHHAGTVFSGLHLAGNGRILREDFLADGRVGEPLALEVMFGRLIKVAARHPGDAKRVRAHVAEPAIGLFHLVK